jgi:Ca2+-binding EF-hand superfamily protein
MIGSIGASSAWSAQSISSNTATQRHKDMFKQLDTDGDGKITETELKADKPADGKGPDFKNIMKQVDTNSDGSIDEAENETLLSRMDETKKPPPSGPKPAGGKGKVGARAASKTQVFDEMDTNKDGTVSLQELMAAKPEGMSETDVQNFMKKIDTNSDGSIDEDENNAFIAKMEERMKLKMQEAESYNDEGKKQVEGTGEFLDVIA